MVATAALASACFTPNAVEGDGGSTSGDESGTAAGVTTVDTEISATNPTADDSSGGCTVDDDCGVGDCEVGVCNNGTCVSEVAPEGTPCGVLQATACSHPDTCDAAGQCTSNDVGHGLYCDECADGPGNCGCDTGECVACPSFASRFGFEGSDALGGWELEGSWGLFLAAPQTDVRDAEPFDSQVLGSDGNRVAPYPGAEHEIGFARSPAAILPEFLEFDSWHVDEGGAGGSDNKRISVSTDNGTAWTVLVDCADPELSAQPFCAYEAGPRDDEIWDVIAIPLPTEFVGELGMVEFAYDTFDDGSGFEQGWFIDRINVATRCACEGDDDLCVDLDSVCGGGLCADTGDCRIGPQPGTTTCGDPTTTSCDLADSCNGHGYCVSNGQPNLLTLCSDCSAGVCDVCEQGVCGTCDNALATNTFDDASSLSGWVPAGDWTLYTEAPPNLNSPDPIPFTSAAFGTDGNRAAPYDGINMETEVSAATTRASLVPEEITFESWHVDEGGLLVDGFYYDNKIIELSIDGGMTWIELVNCSADPLPWAFCTNVFVRPGDDWDLIAIDTAAYEDQVGILRFRYDTVDSDLGFERGWYIDNLNWAYCPAAP